MLYQIKDPVRLKKLDNLKLHIRGYSSNHVIILSRDEDDLEEELSEKEARGLTKIKLSGKESKEKIGTDEEAEFETDELSKEDQEKIDKFYEKVQDEEELKKLSETIEKQKVEVEEPDESGFITK